MVATSREWHKTGVAICLRHFLLFLAVPCRWLLRLKMRPLCAGFCAAPGRSFVVLFSHGQVMLSSNRGRVADPIANDVNRIRGRQFGLPGCPQVVE
jgi:hypothetical protein